MPKKSSMNWPRIPAGAAKKPCDEYTAKVFINLVADLHNRMDGLKNEINKRLDEIDEARKDGQAEREEIDGKIFRQLRAIAERNAGLDDLYKDIKKMMAFWKKYLKPVVWFITFIGGAAVIVFKLGGYIISLIKYITTK